MRRPRKFVEILVVRMQVVQIEDGDELWCVLLSYHFLDRSGDWIRRRANGFWKEGVELHFTSLTAYLGT